VTTTEDLAGLIARRDELKSKIDMHVRFDPAVDAPGDHLRDELGQVVGAITQHLHEPFRVESARLREKRAQITGEHEQAQHQRSAVRNALVHAQAARTATLAYGDDAGEHAATVDELSSEVDAIERLIDDTAARLRGVDAQYVALVVAEGAAMISGVSAS
jgi:seryl-tRNA synthetase